MNVATWTCHNCKVVVQLTIDKDSATSDAGLETSTGEMVNPFTCGLCHAEAEVYEVTDQPLKTPAFEVNPSDVERELKTCRGCGVVTEPWEWCEDCKPADGRAAGAGRWR